MPKPTLTAKEKDAILRKESAAFAETCAGYLADALTALSDRQYASLRQLALMGHPYAKRVFKAQKGRFKAGFGAGTPAPYVINRQGGAFADSFTVQVQQVGGVFSLQASNPEPEARLLAEGTTRMIVRPFDLVAVKNIQQRIARLRGQVQGRLRRDYGIEHDFPTPEITFLLNGLTRRY